MTLQEQIDAAFKRLDEMDLVVPIPDGPERESLAADLRELFWDAHGVQQGVMRLIHKMDALLHKVEK